MACSDELAPGDVVILLCAGALKSGSTWYLRLADALVASTTDGCPCEQAAERRPGSWVIEPRECRVGYLRAHRAVALAPYLRRSRIVALKTHAPPTVSVRCIRRFGAMKTTFVGRDPRHIALALLRHAQGRSSAFPGVTSLADATEVVQLRAAEWQAWQREPDTLRVEFDDLRRDPIGELHRLATHLGRPLTAEAAARIVESVDRASRQDWHETKRADLLRSSAPEPASEEIRRSAAALGPLAASMGYE